MASLKKKMPTGALTGDRLARLLAAVQEAPSAAESLRAFLGAAVDNFGWRAGLLYAVGRESCWIANPAEDVVAADESERRRLAAWAQVTRTLSREEAFAVPEPAASMGLVRHATVAVPVETETAYLLQFLGKDGFAPPVDFDQSMRHVADVVGLRIDLDRGRQRFDDLADWHTGHYWETDENHRFVRLAGVVDVPPSLIRERLLGKTRWEVAGADVMHDPKWQRHLDELQSHRPIESFEFKSDVFGGERFWRISGRPFFDSRGVFRGYRGVASDVTDLFKADRAAHRARTLLHQAIDSLPQLFALWDAEDRLVLFNQSFRRQNAAIAEASQIGVTYSEHVQAALDADLVSEARGREEEWFRERMRRHRNPGPPIEILHRGNTWLLLSENRTLDGGTFLIGTDITLRKRAEIALRQARDELEQRVGERTAELEATNRALRESEALLRLIADNLPVMVAYVDCEQRYAFVNKLFERWMARPAEDLIGRTVREVLGDEAYRTMRSHIAQALAGIPVQYENRIAYPDGTTRDMQMIYRPDVDKDRRIRGYVGLAMDVSAQRASEAQLRQAQKMEAVGQLTGGIAHDFNNLLTVVLGSLELLSLDIDPVSQARVYLDEARQAVERGSLLVQQLLAFARRQALSPRPTDVNALIAGFVPILRRTLGENIEVETTLDEALWPATVDEGQLENVLLNLALNARDALPEGGTITIATANVNFDDDDVATLEEVSPGPYVMLSLADAGSGMSAEVMAHVLEPFFTTKDVGLGSGLGLSMVFGFVKQSRGHLVIDSAPGAGTTVRLYLPRADAAAMAVARTDEAVS